MPETNVQEEQLDMQAEAIIQKTGLLHQREPMESLDLPKGEAATGITSTAAPVTLYNRWSGDPSAILTDQLRTRLRQRFDKEHPWAGQLVYSENPVVQFLMNSAS